VISTRLSARIWQPSGTNLTVITRSLLASFPRKREPRVPKTPLAALGPRFRAGDDGCAWEPSVWFRPLATGEVGIAWPQGRQAMDVVRQNHPGIDTKGQPHPHRRRPQPGAKARAANGPTLETYRRAESGGMAASRRCSPCRTRRAVSAVIDIVSRIGQVTARPGKIYRCTIPTRFRGFRLYRAVFSLTVFTSILQPLRRAFRKYVYATLTEPHVTARPTRCRSLESCMGDA
jgi:hypothetical protein